MWRRLRLDLSSDRTAATAVPSAWPPALPRLVRVREVSSAHREEVGGLPVAPSDVASPSDSHSLDVSVPPSSKLKKTTKSSCPICAAAVKTNALLCAHIRLKCILEFESSSDPAKPHMTVKTCVKDFKLCPK